MLIFELSATFRIVAEIKKEAIFKLHHIKLQHEVTYNLCFTGVWSEFYICPNDNNMKIIKSYTFLIYFGSVFARFDCLPTSEFFKNNSLWAAFVITYISHVITCEKCQKFLVLGKNLPSNSKSTIWARYCI